MPQHAARMHVGRAALAAGEPAVDEHRVDARAGLGGVVEGGAVAYHAVCGAADPGLIYTGKVAVGDLCARCTKRATAVRPNG